MRTLDVVAKAFKWTREQARGELLKVHLSNLPENLAFFSGAIDAAGSFGGIYQSAALAYGSDLVKDPPDPSRFVDLKALEGIQKAGLFKDQKIAIAPIRTSGSGGSTVETNPLLSKDIRFMFEPNSADLDMQIPEQHREPGLDQEADPGEPGLHDTAARPRRQRARRRVPPQAAAKATCASRRSARSS